MLELGGSAQADSFRSRHACSASAPARMREIRRPSTRLMREVPRQSTRLMRAPSISRPLRPQLRSSSAKVARGPAAARAASGCGLRRFNASPSTPGLRMTCSASWRILALMPYTSGGPEGNSCWSCTCEGCTTKGRCPQAGLAHSAASFPRRALHTLQPRSPGGPCTLCSLVPQAGLAHSAASGCCRAHSAASFPRGCCRAHAKLSSAHDSASHCGASHAVLSATGAASAPWHGGCATHLPASS
eukprot:363384-Chlamydomonas_euryale.AAC.16